MDLAEQMIHLGRKTSFVRFAMGMEAEKCPRAFCATILQRITILQNVNPLLMPDTLTLNSYEMHHLWGQSNQPQSRNNHLPAHLHQSQRQWEDSGGADGF